MMGSILWVPVIFSMATTALYWLSANLPALAADTLPTDHRVSFPSSMEELKQLAELLGHYKQQHLLYVLVLFACGYLYKQTFAIPGSVFLNLLAGALFGVWVAFPMTCILTAVGATSCYLLSRLFGKAYIIDKFPEKFASVQAKVEENGDSLFFFLLFLRLFPMSPNWFLNVASPILNIPVHLFFFSVLIGLMPYNFICVQTGGILSEISSTRDIFTWWTIAKLLCVAMAALVPGILMKKFHKENQKQT